MHNGDHNSTMKSNEDYIVDKNSLVTVFTFIYLFTSVNVFMGPFWLVLLSFKIIIRWMSRKLSMHMRYAILNQTVTCDILVSKIHNSKNTYFMYCGSCFWVKVLHRIRLCCWCFHLQGVTTLQRKQGFLKYW